MENTDQIYIDLILTFSIVTYWCITEKYQTVSTKDFLPKRGGTSVMSIFPQGPQWISLNMNVLDGDPLPSPPHTQYTLTPQPNGAEKVNREDKFSKLTHEIILFTDLWKEKNSYN